MTYYFAKTIADGDFESVDKRLRTALEKEGFGVLTEIDVQATLKKKLNVDFRPYRILGACNPELAYQALDAEDKIGTMLPCNVILQTVEDGIEVAAIDPAESMRAVDNPALGEIAGSVRDKLKNVIATL